MSLNQTVMYSQLQSWRTASAPSCTEPVTGPSMPPRLGISYQTTRPHPWRLTLDYEMIPVTPSNAFEKNSRGAEMAALYTRYTPEEWATHCSAKYAEANYSRKQSQKFRNEASRIIRDTDTKTTQGQQDVDKCIAERLTDVTFWRNELNTELEKLSIETLGNPSIYQIPN